MGLDTREFGLRVDETISDGKLDSIEIGKLFEGLTQEEIVEAQAIIEEKITETGAVRISATENLASLNSTVNSFEGIKESLSDKEEIGRLFDVFEKYIDPKLEGFTGIERENIKLIIWDDFQDLFSTQGSLGVLISIVSGNIQESLAPLSDIKAGEEGKNKVLEMIEAGKAIINKFGEDKDTTSGVLEFLDNKLGTNLGTLTEMKQKHPNLDFSQLSVIEQILAGSTDVASIQSLRTNEEIAQEIKTRTEEIATSFEGKAELGTQLSEMIEGLPVGGKEIKDAIGALVEKFPILGFLISMFMGEGFLDSFLSEKNKERKESFNNLIALSQKSPSPISGIFPEELEDNFDITKLEGFFKYLEGKEINYTRGGFWEELISGKTQDSKTKELSDMLKETYGEKIFSSKDAEDEGAGFIKKLNSVKKLIEDKENVQKDAALEETINSLPAILPIPSQEEIVPTIEQEANNLDENKVTPTTQETAEEKPEILEASISPETIKTYTDARNQMIERSVSKGTAFPININYHGSEDAFQEAGIPIAKTIDFTDNGDLLIGGDQYSIKFGEFTHKLAGTIKGLHIVGKPDINGSDIMLTCRTEKLRIVGVQTEERSLQKEKAVALILGILEKGSYSDTIPAKGRTSEIPFDVTAA